MKKTLMTVFLAMAVLFTLSVAALADDPISGKYEGKAEYTRGGIQKGYTSVEVFIFQKEGDEYFGKLTLEKISKRGKVYGKKHVIFRAKISDGKIVAYRKSSNEFMTLNIKNGMLEGSYHFPSVYLGEIELKQVSNKEKPAPDNIKDKFASGDEDDEGDEG